MRSNPYQGKSRSKGQSKAEVDYERVLGLLLLLVVFLVAIRMVDALEGKTNQDDPIVREKTRHARAVNEGY